MNVHEAHEKIHETSTEHGNRRIAMLIAVLAAVLALIEITSRNAEQDALQSNIEASNLWAFYQAKTVRQTTLRTAVENLQLAALPPDKADAAAKQIQVWRATIDRYESEPTPTGGEGRKELSAQAKAAEKRRDHSLAMNHMLELGSGAMQLAIVLASASVVAGVMWLAWAAGGLGLVGVAFGLLGWFAPTLFYF